MKIIITGATGTLGAHLVRALSRSGHKIIATGRTTHPPKRLLDFAEYVQADITHPFSLPDADAIVHCAALASDKAETDEYYAANVTGTRNVCEAARHIPLFIHVSSSSVYPVLDKPLTEDLSSLGDDFNLSPYGLSKLLSEGVVAEFCESPQRFILRPRGLYGPGDKVLLPRMLDMVKDGKVVVPGKMDVQTSLTHLDNFAHAVMCCLNSHRDGLNIYNVSDAHTEILFDSVKKMQDAFYKKELPVKHIPLFVVKTLAAFGARGLTPLYVRTITSDIVLDISKIQRELGYAPQRYFSEALPELVSWGERVGGVESLRSAKQELAWA